MQTILDEYRILTERAVWHERREFGRLRLDGTDRATFLQALVSNDVARLTAGAGLYATYLTPQGRMLADLRLYDFGASLLAVVPAAETSALAARWNDLIFSEDLQIHDVSDELTQMLVVGETAAAAVAELAGISVSSIEALPPLSHLTAATMVVARSDDAALPAFDLFVPAAARAAVVASLEARGVEVGSVDLVEALRIEAARPRFGADMTSDTIPLEAGLLDRAISTTKGCYVGQELIIRVLHRGGGRVARRLVQITADADSTVTPPAGADIFVDGSAAGQITSAARSPRLGRPIALGYVPRGAAQPGTRVSLAFDGHALPATITALAG